MSNEFGFASTDAGGWIVPSDYTFLRSVEIPKGTHFEGFCYFNADATFKGFCVFSKTVVFNRKVLFEREVTFHSDAVFYDDVVFYHGCIIKGKTLFGGTVNFKENSTITGAIKISKRKIVLFRGHQVDKLCTLRVQGDADSLITIIFSGGKSYIQRDGFFGSSEDFFLIADDFTAKTVKAICS